jgi:AcrR family transcriptional regulator
LGRKTKYDEKLVLILGKASSVMARKGYHNTSIRDVAAETGVSPAGLYYYFESKEELLNLILGSCFKPLIQRIRNEVSEIEDPAARLRALIRTHLDHFKDNETEMRVLVHEFRAVSGSYGSKIRGMMREYVDVAVQTLSQIFPEKDAQELRARAFGLFGMLSWVDQWYRPGKDLPLELLADEFGSIFLDGPADAGRARERAEAKKEKKDGDWSKSGAGPSILSGPGF